MNYFKANTTLPRVGGGTTAEDPIIGYTFKDVTGGVRVSLTTWYSEAEKNNNAASIEIAWSRQATYLLPKTAPLRDVLEIISDVLGDFTPAIHLAVQYNLEETEGIGAGNLTTWTPPV